MAANRGFTDFRRLNRSSVTAMSHVRVIVRLRGVAVSALLGANMKIRRYRKPVILAFISGERAATRSMGIRTNSDDVTAPLGWHRDVGV